MRRTFRSSLQMAESLRRRSQLRGLFRLRNFGRFRVLRHFMSVPIRTVDLLLQRRF